MPIGTILAQPAANSINAAYRPIVLRVTASSSTTNTPPVVYCDIYIQGSFYKTLSKTQYEAINISNTEWQFDIQDAIQEYCKKTLEDNGQSNILEIPLISVLIQCKFRASSINTEGFIDPEGTIPIQGTLYTPPTSGDGLNSNNFYGLNVTLQHEDNQSLSAHLSSYKNRVWDANTYPLSHRPDHYYQCEPDSDSFGLISDKVPIKLTIAYITKDNISGELDWNTPCDPVVAIGTPTLPDAFEGTPYNYSISFNGTAPFTLDIFIKPSWLNIVLSGNTVTFSGNPIIIGSASTFEVSIRVTNCSSSQFLLDENPAITSAPVCIPVNIFPDPLPDAIVGTPYNGVLDISGTGPYTLIINSKPSWLTITITGTNIFVTGTPNNSLINIPQVIDFNVTNACGNVNVTRIFNVFGTGRNITVINSTGNLVRLVNSNGSFDYPPYNILPVADNQITFQIMTGTWIVKTLSSMPSGVIETFPVVSQGSVLFLSNLNLVNYIWIHPQ